MIPPVPTQNLLLVQVVTQPARSIRYDGYAIDICGKCWQLTDRTVIIRANRVHYRKIALKWRYIHRVNATQLHQVHTCLANLVQTPLKAHYENAQILDGSTTFWTLYVDKKLHYTSLQNISLPELKPLWNLVLECMSPAAKA